MIIFEVRKEFFLELLYAQQLEKAVMQLVDKLKQVEAAVSRSEFQKLCYLLTVPRLELHSDFRFWVPRLGRLKCWENVRNLLQPLYGTTQHCSNGILGKINVITSALFYEREWRIVDELHDHRTLRCVAWSKGSKLACAGNSGALLFAIASSSKHSLVTEHRLDNQHLGSIYCVSWCEDGELIATGSNDRSICIQRVSEQLKPINGKQILSGHHGTVRSCVFIPHGYILASGGNHGILHLWDVATGTRLSRIQAHEEAVECRQSFDDRTIVSSGGNRLRLWDIRSMRIVRDIGFDSSILSCAVKATDHVSAVGLSNTSMRLIDLQSMRTVIEHSCTSNIQSLDFGANGELAAGCANGDLNIIGKSHEEMQWFGNNTCRITNVRWQLERGKMLAATGTDGCMRLWAHDI